MSAAMRLRLITHAESAKRCRVKQVAPPGATAMSKSLYSYKHLTNTQLLSGLTRLTHDSRQRLAELLAHMAEVDERKLYLEQGCATLFAYAVERLRFSEDEAAK